MSKNPPIHIRRFLEYAYNSESADREPDFTQTRKLMDKLLDRGMLTKDELSPWDEKIRSVLGKKGTMNRPG